MDEKQAVGLLKYHIKTWKGKFPSGHFEACRVAIEALKKQIEEVPNWEGPWNEAKDDAEVYCPECDYYFEDETSYCPDCGQKILWP